MHEIFMNQLVKNSESWNYEFTVDTYHTWEMVIEGVRGGFYLYLSFDIFIAIGRFSAEELLI